MLATMIVRLFDGCGIRERKRRDEYALGRLLIPASSGNLLNIVDDLEGCASMDDGANVLVVIPCPER